MCHSLLEWKRLSYELGPLSQVPLCSLREKLSGPPKTKHGSSSHLSYPLPPFIIGDALSSRSFSYSGSEDCQEGCHWLLNIEKSSLGWMSWIKMQSSGYNGPNRTLSTERTANYSQQTWVKLTRHLGFGLKVSCYPSLKRLSRKQCGQLNKNGLHRLIYLNSWSAGSGHQD